MKQHLQRMASLAGLDVERKQTVPFGTRWVDDLAALTHPSIILDVGANVGQTAHALATKFPSAQIFSFEPVPDTFESLASFAQAHPRVIAVNSAMGASPGTIQIAVAADRAKSSVLNSSPESDLVTVPLNSVDHFCLEQELRELDLLKVDVEGFEMEVLNGASEMLSEQRIKFLLLECDFYPREDEPHGSFDLIWAKLKHFDYRVVSFYTGGVDGNGWKWGNVLFMRPQSSDHLMLSPYRG